MKLAILSVALILAATAQTHDSSPSADEQADNERVLDTITSIGEVPAEDAPKTGEVLFRPILYAGDNGFTAVERLVFVFSPIEEGPNAPATLYSEAGRARYQTTMEVPGPDFGTRFRLRIDKYPTESIDLPGGSYALTEVKYFFTRPDRPGIFNRNFCLSKATIGFDVQNGTTTYLGALAMADLPANSARYSKHIPIISLEPALETATGDRSRVDSLELLPFDGITFEPGNGICPTADFEVAAWRTQ